MQGWRHLSLCMQVHGSAITHLGAFLVVSTPLVGPWSRKPIPWLALVHWDLAVLRADEGWQPPPPPRGPGAEGKLAWVVLDRCASQTPLLCSCSETQTSLTHHAQAWGMRMTKEHTVLFYFGGRDIPVPGLVVRCCSAF